MARYFNSQAASVMSTKTAREQLKSVIFLNLFNLPNILNLYCNCINHSGERHVILRCDGNDRRSVYGLKSSIWHRSVSGHCLSFESERITATNYLFRLGIS